MTENKTELLIEHWKNRAEYYELHHYTADAERCLKHVRCLRGNQHERY
jgi:hypothetical protein